MPANRYFCDCPLELHELVSLSGQELHHLKRVMRTEIGEIVEIVNGKHVLATARLEGYNRDTAELLILSQKKGSPSTPCILAQALPRFERLEIIIEKGTELGATDFWLFPGERSEKISLSPNQMQRLSLLAISALKQCGRLDLPPILLKPLLKDWEKPAYALLFGDTQPGSSPLKSTSEPTIIAIGPGGGFSAGEIAILRDKFGGKGVKLHTNILRSDTAALAALTLLTS